MDRCALFVDAGYVLAEGALAVHGTRNRDSVSWDYAGLLKLLGGLSRDRTGLPLLRCYWYDTAAEGGRGGEHDTLADVPGVKLRLSKVRPSRKEGVEAEIRKDLNALARNRAVSDAVIVSAEEDLAPVIAEIQDLGLRVVLLHISADGNWAISRSLRQECDDIIDLSAGHLRPYVDLIQGAEPGGRESQLASSGYREIATGSAGAGSQVHGVGQQPAIAAPVPQLYPSPVAAEYDRVGQPQLVAPARDQQAGLPVHEASRFAGATGSGGPSDGLPSALDQRRPGEASQLVQQQYQPQDASRGLGTAAATQGQHGYTQNGFSGDSAQSGNGQARSSNGALGQPDIGQPSGSQHGGLTQNGMAASGLPSGAVQHNGLAQNGLPPTGASNGAALAAQQNGMLQGDFGQHSGPLANGQVGGVHQPGGSHSAMQPGAAGQQGQGVPPGQGTQPGQQGQGIQPGQPHGMPGHSAQPQPNGLPGLSVQPGQGIQPGQAVHQGQGLQQSQAVQQQGQAPHQGQPSGMPGQSAPQHGMPGQGMPPGLGGQPGLQHGMPGQGMPPGPGMPPAQPPGLQRHGQGLGLPPGMPGGQQGGIAPLDQQRGIPPSRQMPAVNGLPYPPERGGQFGAQSGQYGPPPGAPYSPAPYSGPQQAMQVPQPPPPVAISVGEAVQSAHAEGFGFGEAVARDAPALWLEAVLARKPRMPSDLEARLLQGSALPIDSLLHDEVRHALRRGFWDALERSRH